MIIRQTAIAAALFLSGIAAHATSAEGSSLPFDLSFSGFGTIAATHATVEKADYVGSRFQPTGAGYTRKTAFGPDTRVGGQINAKFNDKLSGVLQVVSQHQHEGNYKPQVEWANLKYQVTDEFSARVGRIALPSYLISESRFVGYSNPWAHVPTEVYSVLALTSNDGIDITHRKSFGDVNNTFQAFYGSSEARPPLGAKVESKKAWGLNNSVEFGNWTLRAGYSNYEIDVTVHSTDPLFAGLNAVATNAGAVPLPAFQAASQQASSLASKYSTKDLRVSAVSLGATYDPGQWFVMSEYVDFRGQGLLVSSKSWYTTAGYRLGAFTPFVSFAHTKADISKEAGITSVTGNATLDGTAAALNAGLNTSMNTLNGSQKTASVGVRWDAMRNVALKAQYDRVNLNKDSVGRLFNVQPGFKRGSDFDVFTVALDFVF